jgi:hypothetical protein
MQDSREPICPSSQERLGGGEPTSKMPFDNDWFLSNIRYCMIYEIRYCMIYARFYKILENLPYKSF